MGGRPSSLGASAEGAELRLFLQSGWLLMLVGHDKAFTKSSSMLSRYKDVPLVIGPSWKAALTELSDDALREQFADVLDEKRIQALGQRRDLLLSR